MEDKDLIHAVDELRLEDPPDFLHDPFLHEFVFLRVVVHGGEPEAFRGNDVLRAGVAGHDQDRVLEIDLPPLSVGDMAIVEYLQENVKYIRMGFLDLVKQDHAVRAAAHFLT